MSGPAPTITIRRLTTADAALWRAIRLEALEQDPDAFGSTFARENAEPLVWFAERLNGSRVFGAWDLGTIVGTAGLYWARDGAGASEEVSPRAFLWAVYVQPAYRGIGLGRRLVEAAIEELRPQGEALYLKVNRENRTALRLYERLGFISRSIETNAIERGGRFYDEVLMVRTLP